MMVGSRQPMPADPHVVTWLARFVAYEMARGMHPDSVAKVYVPHIVREFTHYRVANNFHVASRHPFIKSVMAGYERIYFKITPRGTTKRLAFTAEFLSFAAPAMAAPDAPRGFTLASGSLALKMGMWFCLRKGEYLPNRKYAHLSKTYSFGMRLADITFSGSDAQIIPFADLREGRATMATINIRSSKTDQHGVGRIRQLAGLPQGVERVTSCLVRDLERHVCMLRDDLDAVHLRDYLFAVNGSVLITSDDVSKLIKACVMCAGMDPSRYSPHSLRYGGATMLAAAGYPVYLIEYHGGWAPNSSSIRIYMQIGGAGPAAAIAMIMSGREELDIDHVRLIDHVTRVV